MSETNGVAKFSSAGIVVEFESKLFGLIGGEVKEVGITLDEILDIKFCKGIYRFFAKIQLRLRNFAKLSALPNNSGKVELKIKREDFELAREAVEQTLRYMNQSHEQFPPAQTSVGELFDTKKLKSGESKETKKLD